jgi:HSP90 family molecular chaperone
LLLIFKYDFDFFLSFIFLLDTTNTDLIRGTKIILKLKELRYSNTTIIKYLVEKYSQYIDYPVYIRREKEGYVPSSASDKEEEDERVKEG